MKDIEHARMMLEMAGKDLKALGGMSNVDIFDDGIFGFHTQQAVEKGLKAWLALLEVEYPKTHDIRLLFQLLKEKGIITDPFIDLIQYNAFAVQFRYESYIGDDEAVNREEALRTVAALLEHIGKLIPSG